jgi:hypothetical protein
MPGALLLAAVAAGAAAQGAFYGQGRGLVGALVAAALVVAMVRWSPSVADLRFGPVLAATGLAGWAVLNGLGRGEVGGAAGYVLLLAGVVAVLLVCRRLGAGERELLLGGLLAVGVLVAAAGWVGVAWRLRPWALPDQGLWRAASTLTYANATAALVVPLALLALGMLAGRRRQTGLALVATGLLVGAGATLSRAGALGLLVGLLLLAMLVGAGPTLRAVAGPAVGAVVALVGLLPAMPATAAPQPALSATALVAGLGLAAVLTRLPGRAMAAAALTVAATGWLLVAGWAPPSLMDAGDQIRAVRFSTASADRSGATTAALHQLADQPLAGVGPGQAVLRWSGPDGALHIQRYVHNEYLQVTTELGVVGGVLLAVLLGALAAVAGRGRKGAPSRTVWAGIVAGLGALAVHSCFDFVWHLSVIPLVTAVLVGTLVSPGRRPPAAHGTQQSNTNQKEMAE